MLSQHIQIYVPEQLTVPWVPVGKVGHALLCTTEAFLITATPSSLEKSRSGDAQFLRDLPFRWYSSLDSLMLSKR